MWRKKVIDKIQKKLPKLVIKKAWCNQDLTPFISLNPYGSPLSLLPDTVMTDVPTESGTVKKFVKGPQMPTSYLKDEAATKLDFTEDGFVVPE